MGEILYNKLIRDEIPTIIEESHKKCVTKRVTGEELMQLLNKKLAEEVEEYLESNSIEELADILEVIHGIVHHRNIDFDELEKMRAKKRDERGGFLKGIKLIKVY
ncbi:nucleoside triphosphate pyrophosphohydrolase [Tindallia californiensis]|uniref:Predicted house-cleaning noncanonical NTP pyrophosphatase, all-alpha NTP-PPase (MazG) superfamily n=1 Tax=Tindallia californiensis TaxID=159292 RepID=A0A1H3QH91_9FIRM|nr:nucleoside triphosphate pyrophosphohydrolase [Tindallia californiensis]SDZ12375.1 Predicted house-cleaning noncanonical NTP pyrophosphatase, all-alpha NTP-PPase (MazG) superfamily [Tindallia californiensis]